MNEFILTFLFQELEQKRQQEVDSLREELQQLTSNLEKLDLSVRKLTAGHQQMEETIKTETTAAAGKKQEYAVKKRTMDLLPQAEENIKKLQVNIAQTNCICSQYSTSKLYL